jgi:Spy/CpxP family protein refolding chaperone
MGQGLETMQATLGLSDAQVTQIKAVYESHHAALKTDGEQVKTDLEKLSGLVASKGSDSDLSAAISELKADRETERAERAKQMEEVDAILTPSQLAQRILAEAAKKEGEREEQRGGQRGPQ